MPLHGQSVGGIFVFIIDEKENSHRNLGESVMVIDLGTERGAERKGRERSIQGYRTEKIAKMVGEYYHLLGIKQEEGGLAGTAWEPAWGSDLLEACSSCQRTRCPLGCGASGGR